jgi:hypothetical protein
MSGKHGRQRRIIHPFSSLRADLAETNLELSKETSGYPKFESEVARAFSSPEIVPLFVLNSLIVAG